MKDISITFFIVILAFVSASSAFTCGNKNKTIANIQKGISNYLDFSQYSKLCGYIETDITNQENVSKIFDNFPNYLLSCLSQQQTVEVVAKGAAANNEMQGMTLMEMLSQLGEGLRENLQTFFQKLINKSKKMASNKKSENAILKEGYEMVFKFVTEDKLKQIMCNIRNRFTDQQWGVVYKNFGSCFNFDNYECTKVD